jgi:integrase
MSLYKRGNTYWISFTSPNGQRIRESARTQDRKQAQEYEDRLKAELWRVQQLGEKQRRTWQEAVVRWLKETEHKKDHEKDKAKFRWLDPYLGDFYLDEITRDLIDSIRDAKREEASPSTVNRYLAVIRAVLNTARDDWEWIDRAPKVKEFKEPKIHVRWITPDDATRLIAALPAHLAAMAEFSLQTGLRQANVSYLKWEQVSLERQTAWIHADESKNGKALAVPLNKAAMSVLHRQLGKHDCFVFTYQGKPVQRTSTKAWKRALADAGITNFRWHDLRHTWASWHVQNGTTLQELMELGGWSSFEMVLRYAHLRSDHLLTAAKRLEGTNLTHHVHKGGLRLVES